MRRYLFIIGCVCAWLLAGCRDTKISTDPNARLSFLCDTLTFDTVFTEQGSATAQMMVYNRNKEALVVDKIWLTDGTAFEVNIDGEPKLDRLTRVQINGGDSLFVFVRVNINPTGSNSPVLVRDMLHFHLTNDITQHVGLQAYGQDVTRIGRKGCGRTEYASYRFTADKPYLVFDTMIVGGALTMDAGATVYMHSGGCIYALGDVTAKGTKDAPISVRGDRLDRLFDSVPYAYAGGSWNGIYLQAEKAQNYLMEYVDILSGNIGLYCYSVDNVVSNLRMDGCRIHNHTLYGLVLINTDALVTNTEISNCASYCIYCAGGTQDFVHTTVASYFGNTNIRIQSAAKEDAAAVYIDNLSKTAPTTVTSFYNSIITGALSNQLVLATPLDRYYAGTFVGNYLKTDTLAIPHAERNIYADAADTTHVFRNDFYKYKEYVYYDFRLDSLSPAIGIGDSIAAVPYATDRDGYSRAGLKPDAGCYQYHP